MGIDRFRTKPITIRSSARTDDGMGGYTLSGKSSTPEKAAQSPIRGFEQEMWSRRGVQADWKFILGSNAVVSEDDDIICDEEVYNVTYAYPAGGKTKQETGSAHLVVLTVLAKGRKISQE